MINWAANTTLALRRSGVENANLETGSDVQTLTASEKRYQYHLLAYLRKC